MKILRRITIFVCSIFLSLWLYSLAGSVAFTATAGNPEYVKKLLSESGTYKSIINDVISFNKAGALPDSSEQAAKKEVVPILQKTLTPEILQTNAELIIDGTTNWLNGKTTEPDFVIQVAPIRSAIIANTSDYFYTKVSNLPVCPQLQKNYDPLTATCRPRGQLNKADFDRSATDFANDLPLLKDDVLTFTSLTASSKNKTELPEAVPSAYTWAKRSPYIFAALALLSVLAIILLKKDHFAAWKGIGHTFLLAGLLLVASAAVTQLFFNESFGLAVKNNAATLGFVQPILQKLNLSLSNFALYFGVSYVAIAALCYFIGFHIHRGRKLEDPEEQKSALPEKAIV